MYQQQGGLKRRRCMNGQSIILNICIVISEKIYRIKINRYPDLHTIYT